MNIHLMYEYGSDLVPHGSSYIRLLYPFENVQFQYPNVRITKGTQIDSMQSEIYVIERMWKPGITLLEAEDIIHRIKAAGKTLIYTLDDNLLDLVFNRNGIKWPSSELKNVVRTFAKESHGIIVSTEPLKTRLEKFNSNIHVIPNYLSDDIVNYKKEHKKSNGLTFGYMGTASHKEDLMMILPAVKHVLKNYDITFEIVGVLAEEEVEFIFGADSKVRVLKTTGNVEYPRFMKWMANQLSWDFAIAPLKSTRFTLSKSDIKILDYGILGIPGIFSDIPNYRENIVHGKNGLLAGNTVEEWTENLVRIIEDGSMPSRL